MPRATTRKSSQNITALLPPQVRARIEEAAAWQGVSAASFLVAAAAQAADEVIEKERRFRLTREDADLVAALLDDPPAPNAALRRAADRHARLTRG